MTNWCASHSLSHISEVLHLRSGFCRFFFLFCGFVPTHPTHARTHTLNTVRWQLCANKPSTPHAPQSAPLQSEKKLPSLTKGCRHECRARWKLLGWHGNHPIICRTARLDVWRVDGAFWVRETEDERERWRKLVWSSSVERVLFIWLGFYFIVVLRLSLRESCMIQLTIKPLLSVSSELNWSSSNYQLVYCQTLEVDCVKLCVLVCFIWECYTASVVVVQTCWSNRLSVRQAVVITADVNAQK